jgi:hypothetical protein
MYRPHDGKGGERMADTGEKQADRIPEKTKKDAVQEGVVLDRSREEILVDRFLKDYFLGKVPGRGRLLSRWKRERLHA